MCTKNYDHMIYASWDMECHRHNFLSFWAIFCPLLIRKIRIWKKCKKTLEILTFYTCVWFTFYILSFYTCLFTHFTYDVWFLRYKTQQTVFFLSFWATFCPLTLLTSWKIKILKKWKICVGILSVYTCVPQMTSYDVWFLRYRAQ